MDPDGFQHGASHGFQHGASQTHPWKRSRLQPEDPDDEDEEPHFQSGVAPSVRCYDGLIRGRITRGDCDREGAVRRMKQRILIAFIIGALYNFIRTNAPVSVRLQVQLKNVGGESHGEGRSVKEVGAGGGDIDVDAEADAEANAAANAAAEEERQKELKKMITMSNQVRIPPQPHDDDATSDRAFEHPGGSTNPFSKVKVDLSCELKQAAPAEHPVELIITANYPGSGAKMTRMLIEAITGLVTGNDQNLSDDTNFVSVKTHYPHVEGQDFPGSENVQRAILLLRNPIYAIPALCSSVYESQLHLPEQSRHASLELWLNWREKNYVQELDAWKEHTRYWMQRYGKADRLLVSYERLVDETKGPKEATRLAKFFYRSQGVKTRPMAEIPCVWRRVINYNNLSKIIRSEGGAGRRMMSILRGGGGAEEEQQRLGRRQRQFGSRRRMQETKQDSVAEKGDEDDLKAPQEQILFSEERGGPIILYPLSEIELQMAIYIFEELLAEYEGEGIFEIMMRGFIKEAIWRIDVLHKESEHMFSYLA